MGVIGACAGCCWVRRCQAWRFQLNPADGPQERQARGEREREGAEDEVPAVKGVAERRILGVYELVLAGLVARASPSVLGSSRSPRPWRSWRPSAACRRKCPVWRLCTHQQPAHAPLTPIACFADRWPALSRQIQVFATSYDRHVQLHSTTAKRSRRHRQGRGGKTWLPEMEVPRSTFQRTVTTVGPYTRPELEVDVPVKVPEELPLQVCHNQRLVEVRGVGQLDDLLCSSGGSCRVHPPKTRTTR